MVEGAIRYGTTMQVEANYTDSHGQSEIGFGITRPLGFDLLPRIKRINKVRLYRPATGHPSGAADMGTVLTRDRRLEERQSYASFLGLACSLAAWCSP